MNQHGKRLEKLPDPKEIIEISQTLEITIYKIERWRLAISISDYNKELVLTAQHGPNSLCTGNSCTSITDFNTSRLVV